MKSWFSNMAKKIKEMGRKKKIILEGAVVAVIIVAVSLIIIFTGSSEYVTVSFNTGDGEKVESVRLEKGGTLDKMPMAYKDGYVFTGWFLDEACEESFYTSKTIDSDITLYARYKEQKPIYKEEALTEYFLDDCEPMYSFKISSETEITEENLYDYIIIDSFKEDIPELKVTKDVAENVYVIEPKTEYVAGRMYEVVVTNGASFADIGVVDEDLSALVTLQFTIHKDEVYDVVYKDGIIERTFNEVKMLQEGYYMLMNPAATNVQVGSTVRVTDKESGLDTFFNVDAIENQGEYSVLSVSDCAMEELVEEFEVYSKDVAMDIDALLEQINKDAIVKAIETSEGTDQLTNVLALAIKASPTVNKLANNATNTGYGDNAHITDGIELDIDASYLREGMFVKAELGKAENKNFTSDLDIDWLALHITIGYETKINNTATVQISFGITQYIKMDADGAGSLKDLYAEGHLDVYTQTDVELKAYVYSSQEKVPSTNPEDSGFVEDIIDISDEIVSAFKGESDDNIVAEMQEVLKSSGDSINLLRQPLIMVPIPIEGVFQITFGLDLVINLDLAAGINIDMSMCNHNRFGIEVDLGLTDSSVGAYHTKNSQYNKSSFDLYAAGYVGLEVGLAGYAEFSFIGIFAEFGAVGLELQMGIYLDIYGYMHISFETGKSAGDYDGALYMETGVYVSLDIYIESDILDFREDWEIFHFKLRLGSWGNKETVIGIEIEQKDNDIPVMRGSRLNLTDLYTITKKYMDITTGEIRTEPYTGDIEMTFSERNFRYSDYSQVIFYDNASTTKGSFYVTAYIYATDYIWTWLGGSKKDVSTAEFKFLWVEPNYTGVIDNGKDIVTITYGLEVDGEIVATKTREVVAGSLPGAIDWDIVIDKDGNNTAYVKTYGTSYGSWDKNPNNTVVNEDTTFTYTTYKQYKYVSIIYYDGMDWIGQVYAVNVGDTPNIEIPNVDGLTFNSWISSEDEQYVSVYGKPDGQIKTILEFETVTAAWSKYAPYIEDMTKPIISEKFASSDEAWQFLQNNATTYKDRADQIYLAKYDTIYYDVTFETKRGNYNYEYTFGQKPAIDTNYITSVLGYEFIGWDANDDGQVDYQTSELPVVVTDNKYVAIYTENSFDVTVYDADMKLTVYENMQYGDSLPEAIAKLSDVEVKDEAGNVIGKNKFMGWCWRHRDVYTGVLQNPIPIENTDGMVVIGSDVYYPYYVYTTDLTETLEKDPNKLNISDGTNLDIYDTTNNSTGTQTIEGYYYDAKKSALYITANDLELSGYAKNIVVIIGENVERITLSDLTIEATDMKSYKLSSISGLSGIANITDNGWANIYDYALIRILSKNLDMTISGNVSLTKDRVGEEDCVTILNIADFIEVDGELVALESNINIQGKSTSDKLTVDGDMAIRHGGSINVINLNLITQTDYTAISVEKDITMNLTSLTTKINEEMEDFMEQAVAAGGKISIMDCELDVEGRLQSDCYGDDDTAISITGNTSGKIHAEEMSPLYLSSNFEEVNKKIYIAIYSGCQLTLEMENNTESVICTGDCNTLEIDGVTTDRQCVMKLDNEDAWYKLYTSDGELVNKLTIMGSR